METLEVVEKSITIAVASVGGIVAWVKFVGGRAHKVRLEPTISCQVLDEQPAGTAHLLITAGLSNKGLFSASVPRTGFHVEILAPEPEPPGMDIYETVWAPLSALRAFRNHSSVEVGESVQDQLRFAVDTTKHHTLKLRLRVKHDGRKWGFIPVTKGTEWEAVVVVDCKVLPPQAS